MANERSIAAAPLDEFERVKAIVTSYRLVDTPAIVAAREYGYDIGLLKSSVARALRYQASPANHSAAAGGGLVRESHGGVADDRLADTAVAMLRQLTSKRVRFVVIGGVAAQLHGSTRVTQDLDILYDAVPDNLERLATLLLSWRASLRGAEPGLPFSPDAATIKALEVLTLETERGDIDVFQRVAGVGRYPDALPDMEPFRVADFAVRALSLDALIKSKLAAGRPRDITEVLELKTLRDISAQQRTALEQKTPD